MSHIVGAFELPLASLPAPCSGGRRVAGGLTVRDTASYGVEGLLVSRTAAEGAGQYLTDGHQTRRSEARDVRGLPSRITSRCGMRPACLGPVHTAFIWRADQ